MDAGAGGGKGRLEKIKAYGRKNGGACKADGGPVTRYAKGKEDQARRAEQSGWLGQGAGLLGVNEAARQSTKGLKFINNPKKAAAAAILGAIPFVAGTMKHDEATKDRARGRMMDYMASRKNGDAEIPASERKSGGKCK